MGRAISLQLHDHVSALLLRTEFVPVDGPVFELDLAKPDIGRRVQLGSYRRLPRTIRSNPRQLQIHQLRYLFSLKAIP